MRLSVAEVRNLHPARRPDRLLTTAGLARGVQRRAEVPSFRQRRAEVPAGRPEKPALSISVQTKRPSFRMHTPRRVIHDTFSLRSFRRRSRRRSSARLSRCSRCAQRKNPAHPRLSNMDEHRWLEPPSASAYAIKLCVCDVSSNLYDSTYAFVCVVVCISVAQRTAAVCVLGVCVCWRGYEVPPPSRV